MTTHDLTTFLDEHPAAQAALRLLDMDARRFFPEPRLQLDLASDADDGSWTHLVLTATIAMAPDEAFALLERFRDECPQQGGGLVVFVFDVE